ncbi:MAG: NifU family protein, partial [Haloarculaceae archaeon]
MSTETEDGDDLRERITNFLRRNFPQIQMHGGSAAIEEIDREEGSVTIRLGGACSGCGISPMTIQAIKTRMTKEIPEIETVSARTGMDGNEGMAGGAGMSPSMPGDSRGGDAKGDDEGPEAPF